MTADEMSTSARLARVERENEQMRAEIGRLRTEADRHRARAERLRAFWQACSQDRDAIAAERDGVRESLAERAGRVEDLEATLAMRTRQLRDVEHDRDHIAQERDQARAGLRALLRRTHTEPSVVQEKSMTKKMTPEQHYARGAELLAVAENAPAFKAEDYEVARTRAAIAQAHFTAAAASARTTEPTTSPLDNDREARAVALRFALDLAKDYRTMFNKEDRPEGDALTKQILADADAFDAFIRRGMLLDRSAPAEPDNADA